MSHECEAIVQAGEQVLVSVDHAQPGDDILVTIGSGGGEAGPVEWDAIQGKPSEFVPESHAADHDFDGADPVTLQASQVRTGVDSTYFSTDDPLTQTLAIIEGELVDRVSTSDTRLVNSREWTAATVDQAEAEAGTATTRRAWTAQRVRQAIAAWWSALAVPISKITGLQTALDSKAASTHQHATTQIRTPGDYGLDEIDSFVEVCAQDGFNQALTNVLGGALLGHTHNALDITAGILEAARMGTGTAGEGNFLRGDRIWSPACEVFEFTRTSRPSAATGTNGSYTFSVPAGAKAVEFLAIGGGGGGGSGRRGAAGTARFGGGGGGGGNATSGLVPASTITTSLTIAVGAGGAGGAAVTTNDTNGHNGSVGNITSVTYNSVMALQASPGTGGGGGTASAGTSGSSFSNAADTWRNTAGVGSSSVTATAGSAFVAPGLSATGGAAGGGISTGNVAYGGGTQFLPSAQSAITGLVPSNQTAGSASTTATGGAGPNGPNYGYGGNGGGASANGFNSGAGGNGGDGYVRITVWY